MKENRSHIIADDRYDRLRLISGWDQDRLRASSIIVVGIGALGNEVAKNLALLGIGRLVLVDCDRVEGTNLTRSVLFRERDTGRYKADVAAEALRDLNPDVKVEPHNCMIQQFGLGHYLDCDVVIGCLDNREARWWLNRMCWRVGRPWIDGGIQELSAVVKMFDPPDGPCYECGLTENDYRLMYVRYRCPMLRPEDLQQGKVPTVPTIASLAAGLQVQEALKLLHGESYAAGMAIVFDGHSHSMYKTRLPYNEDCLAHEQFETPRQSPWQSTRVTAAEVLRASADVLGSNSLRLQLERGFLSQLRCIACARQEQVDMPHAAVDPHRLRCPQCGELRQADVQYSIESEHPLAEKTLAEVGIPPRDIICVQSQSATLAWVLDGERTDHA